MRTVRDVVLQERADLAKRGRRHNGLRGRHAFSRIVDESSFAGYGCHFPFPSGHAALRETRSAVRWIGACEKSRQVALLRNEKQLTPITFSLRVINRYVFLPRAGEHSRVAE